MVYLAYSTIKSNPVHSCNSWQMSWAETENRRATIAVEGVPLMKLYNTQKGNVSWVEYGGGDWWKLSIHPIYENSQVLELNQSSMPVE